ncbi:MAG: AmmeMemoRadiSam system protein B [Candidatus Omnitrophica bacterium]|nr:AmmeMemoRadiSam system protein B [Candidatus Omnitrophota bacterium]
MRKKVLIFSFIFIFFTIKAQDFKDCEFCGTFYPKEQELLNSIIDDFLKEAQEKIDGQILGIVSPHAGYMYSGKVAAYSYKILENEKFETVILLGPTHRYYFEGIAIYKEGFFKVPLGVLEIDKVLTEQFSLLKFANFNNNYFVGEHSLEVQLPFILKTVGTVKIVPILFGKISYQELKEFAQKLVQLSLNKKILIIVSTDFSHYLKYDEAVNFDRQTINLLENMEDYALFVSEQLNGGRACGIMPLISFILYSKNKNAKIKILKYLNSGDTAGDKNRVVGYVSAVSYIP